MAELVDEGRIRTTATETLSPINAANLIEAHRRIESTTTRGKIVLEGWDSRRRNLDAGSYEMRVRAGQANANSPATIAMAWSTKRAFSPTGAT